MLLQPIPLPPWATHLGSWMMIFSSMTFLLPSLMMIILGATLVTTMLRATPVMTMLGATPVMIILGASPVMIILGATPVTTTLRATPRSTIGALVSSWQYGNAIQNSSIPVGSALLCRHHPR